jgi:Phytanoyl-CoA dioxygenase (PhyH)
MGTAAQISSSLRSTIRLVLGAIQFWNQGQTPPAAYQSLIHLFCQSGGSTNDWLSRLVSLIHPPYRLEDAGGVLGQLDAQALDKVIEQLDEEGYYVFAQRLPVDLSARLLNFALTHRCTVRPMDNHGSGSAPKQVEYYNRENPEGVRYDFSAQDVIDNPDVQQLMADSSIIAVAQRYLRCKPILDVMSMWWHTAHSRMPDKGAAQFWHFDMDRIKWLKFFIYLTDVGPENGPHSFVAGSHRTKGIPSALRNKGYARLMDEEVEVFFPRDKFLEFTAPRGTIIAEDTRGLHKGKLVSSGDRLVLQLQFSNSLFGGCYAPSRFTRIVNEDLKSMVQQYSRLYANYTQ